MHESEAAFQAVVDPYARADFFISFGEQGVDLEEGYITFTELPGGLLTKVGKMRAAFGKVNTLHNHVLPWTDRPLVTNNLVGGEDGIDDAGISVARLIPNPWIFLEATGQVFRGDSGDVQNPLFTTSQRGQVSYVGHLRGYQDLSESTNIDLGVSVSRGYNASGLPADIDNLTTRLFGVDATLRWKPLQRSIYHSFVGRSEVIWSRREQLNGTQNGTGFYVSAEYQLARRWFAGVRFDGSDRRGQRGAARHRRLGDPDLLAERVQPGARAIPAHQLRHRTGGQRVPVPVPVFHRRARRASVLRGSRSEVRGQEVRYEDSVRSACWRALASGGAACTRQAQRDRDDRGPGVASRARSAATGSRSSRSRRATRIRISSRRSPASSSNCRRPIC